MMAFGVHLDEYDGGYCNMALYILSRTHSIVLLFVLLNHGPTRVSLERLDKGLKDKWDKNQKSKNPAFFFFLYGNSAVIEKVLAT
jgi:hypothetical protein